MKKRILELVITIIFMLSILYTSMPEYHIFSSISYSTDTERETTIKVIIYKYHNLNELVNQIRLEHDRINIVSSKLTIQLYHSRYGSKPFKTVIFLYKK